MKRAEKVIAVAMLLLLIAGAWLFGTQLYAAQHSVVMICGDQPGGQAVYLYEQRAGKPILVNPDPVGLAGQWWAFVPYGLPEVWLAVLNETSVPNSAVIVSTSDTSPVACGLVGPTPEIYIGAVNG